MLWVLDSPLSPDAKPPAVKVPAVPIPTALYVPLDYLCFVQLDPSYSCIISVLRRYISPPP